MKNKWQLLICIVLLLGVWACRKSEELNLIEFMGFHKPIHFPEPIYNFSNTALTKETFELGRKLFYDGILSRDNTISCASCHVGQNAFTHHGHDVSHGIDDQLGIRNAPPLVNLAWSTSFFWDGGVQQLDLSSIVPIHNPIEMDENMENVVSKLQKHPEYPSLFHKAFNSKEIKSNQVLKALSYFMVMLISANAKYDRVMRNQDTFTTAEKNGYQIFQTKCNSCHREPLFTDQSFRDNGLGINPAKDLGRYEITMMEEDKLKFKVPTLRNLQYTAPYMHDGRIYTLQAVLNHYSKEVNMTENIDPLLKENKGIPLTELEMEELLAFLKTLNDESFVNKNAFIQP